MPVRESQCFVRAKLAQAVADAVVLMTHAKRDLEKAKVRRADLGPSTLALSIARRIERKAVLDFENHKKEHGC